MTCILWTSIAQAVGEPRIAVMPLRPTEDASFGETRLDQLKEAQELSDVLASVLEVTSGGTVVDAAEVRRLLGRTYLLEVFECSGKVGCIIERIHRLRGGSVDLAVTGDLFPQPDAISIRLRVFDVKQNKLTHETVVELTREQSRDLAEWRNVVGQFFSGTGSVRVTTNVVGAACAIDGAPCELDADGQMLGVNEGQHTIELTLEGYKAATAVVIVKRGEETRLSLPMQPLPRQVEDAPDPLALQAPTTKVDAAAGKGATVVPIGQVQLTAMVDNHNTGNTYDLWVRAKDTVERKLSYSFLPVPSTLGVSVVGIKTGGWEFRGAVSGGYVIDFVLGIDQCYVDALRPESGLKLTFGRFSRAVVNTLAPGTLTYPFGFGNLNPLFTGMRIAQSAGPFTLELAVGRPERTASAATAGNILQHVNGSGGRIPFVSGRVAYVNSGIQAPLYGQPYSLTLSVSGAYGKTRYGGGERATLLAQHPTAHEPLLEDVVHYIGSFEYALPVAGAAMLLGELYVGRGANMWLGAVLQPHRIILATGRHRPLDTIGGWSQLSIPLGDHFDLNAVVGAEHVYRGFLAGPNLTGDPDIQMNSFGGIALGFTPVQNVRFGLQAHRLETRFRLEALDSEPILGGTLATQLRF